MLGDMERSAGVRNRTVLILASHFPPEARAGGVLRVAKLVKYLPALGWEPIVVTSRSESVAGTRDPLAEEIRGIGRVYRLPRLDMRRPFHWLKIGLRPLGRILSKARQPSKEGLGNGGDSSTSRPPLASRILIPDHLAIWGLLATLRSLVVILSRKVDAIYATSPLQSSLVAGYLLRRMTGVPFVVEMRDPWTTNPMAAPRASRFLCWIDALLEEKVLLAADRVVVINENFIPSICQKFPGVDEGKFVVIPNGFDFDDFDQVAPIYNARFTIVHAGNFYPGRTPIPFLSALAKLAAQRPDVRADWVVKFVGSGREYASTIDELGIADMIEFVDFVPHHVALGHVLGADVLLLVPGVGKGTMSGKIFEYIAARKPVLVVADECAAAELVRRSGVGVVVPPRDLDEVAERCAAFFDDIQSGVYVYPDVGELLAAYDRKSIARRCADVMGAVAVNGR